MPKLDTLQRVAEQVHRRACRHGSIHVDDIRELIARAGLPEERWRDVLSATRYMLTSGDSYLYSPTASDREQRRQLRLRRVVHQLIRAYRSFARLERRNQGRSDFVRPVTVRGEDGHSVKLLSTNLSPTGIRLVSAASLLGQKLRVSVLNAKGMGTHFQVRVVWSSMLSDGLWENGGAFLTVTASPLRIQAAG